MSSALDLLKKVGYTIVNWNNIIGKPSTFTPSAHKSTHATGGADALTPVDIGAVANLGSTPSIQSGNDANKPTAGTAGRLYVATDTGTIYRDDGKNWITVGTANFSKLTNVPNLVTSITAGTGISVTNPTSPGAATVSVSNVPNSALAGPLVSSITAGTGISVTNPTGIGSATVSIPNGGVTASMLASGAAVTNIGYTPVNKAGDTMTGTLTIDNLAGKTSANTVTINGNTVWHAGNTAIHGTATVYHNSSTTITLGFRPSFVMIMRSNNSPCYLINGNIYNTNLYYSIGAVTSTGFIINNLSSSVDYNDITYIAFA